MDTVKIKEIDAREILDSRGVPTIECSILLDNKIKVKSSVPSGASVGINEALELRDCDSKRYSGLGVLSAIKNIKDIIAPKLIGQPVNYNICDQIMLNLDGTSNKKKLGANAILAVSIAVARGEALVSGEPLYKKINSFFKARELSVPLSMFNILNGGAHAVNNLSFQELMIIPVSGSSFANRLEISVNVYNCLKKILVGLGYFVGVGDEGGFAPNFLSGKIPEYEALDILVNAIDQAGYAAGKDVLFCIDVAASQFFDNKSSLYKFHDREISADKLIDIYEEIINKYPVYSIEDGISETDWQGWRILTDRLGRRVKLVGDDLFVSNPKFIKKGAETGVGNAVLIKPNQIGSVTEVLNSIKVARKSGYEVVVSHRSGETSDTFIADLAVGAGTSLFKSGAPCRGERVAKYNRLLEIETELSQNF